MTVSAPALLDQVLAATSGNTSFSQVLPGLQIAIDSTSLGEFKLCPRRYLYRQVLGYVPRTDSVHLVFGIWLHQARERYDAARVGGAPHEAALRRVLAWIMAETWDKVLGRPWNSDHNIKNRFTLVRTIVWYLDALAANDPLQTITLANGRPAVELSFRFDFGFVYESTGETVLACGHLDRLTRMNGEAYIADIKTTMHTLGPSFFAKFAPDNQIGGMYPLAARVAFHEPIRGIIVDGVQVAVGFTRFQRALVPRDEAQVAEWHQAAGWWVRQMEACALALDWPMNDKSCDVYGGCPYRGVCSKSPAARGQWLDLEFKRRQWDPLQVRGDI